MNKKKITIAILLLILIVSDLLMMFGKDFLGPYINVAAMISILSGIALIIMIIVNRRKSVVQIKKVNNEFDLFTEKKKEVKICNICNAENKLTATYCTKCGSDLKDITCPICNTVNPFDQKYCTNCDTILQNKKRH